jgi:glutamate--cysteine ligase
LLYDDAALSAAWDLVKDWTIDEHEMLRRNVPRQGLKTPLRSGTAKDIARQMVAIASDGLKARAAMNAAGLDERIFLQELEEIASTGCTPAERLLEQYHGPWQGDVRQLYAAESF